MSFSKNDEESFFSDSDSEENINLPNIGGLFIDNSGVQEEMDAFEDAGHKNKIHIRYQKRNNKKVWTKIEGIEKEIAKKITKTWKKGWGCNASIQKEEDNHVIILNGDHRGKVSRYLLENKIAEEIDIEIHGPQTVD